MITFTPSKLGSRSGTVTVRGQDNPGAIVTVTGTGSRRPPVPTGPAQFGGTPNPVNFGSDIPLRNPGQTQNVTVTNAAAQALPLTRVDVIDARVPGARGRSVLCTSVLGPATAGR